MVLDSGGLNYDHLKSGFEQFLSCYQIAYEAYMFFQHANAEKEELVSTDWTLSLQEIE